jgi:hypothetical protein
MKKFIASCLIGGGLLLSSVVGAGAASNHTELGTPGAANCHGQTAAAVAQLGKTFGVPPQELRGLAGFARINDASVSELQQAIDEYCNEVP